MHNNTARLNLTLICGIIVTLTAGLVIGLTPAALADGWPTPVPRPARDDPTIITEAGEHTQQQVDANHATYLTLQDYVDQTETAWKQTYESARNTILVQQDQLAQRDIDCANALNAKQDTIWTLEAERDRLRQRLNHKTTKIAELRAIIRELRD